MLAFKYCVKEIYSLDKYFSSAIFSYNCRTRKLTEQKFVEKFEMIWYLLSLISNKAMTFFFFKWESFHYNNDRFYIISHLLRTYKKCFEHLVIWKALLKYCLRINSIDTMKIFFFKVHPEFCRIKKVHRVVRTRWGDSRILWLADKRLFSEKCFTVVITNFLFFLIRSKYIKIYSNIILKGYCCLKKDLFIG